MLFDWFVSKQMLTVHKHTINNGNGDIEWISVQSLPILGALCPPGSYAYVVIKLLNIRKT